MSIFKPVKFFALFLTNRIVGYIPFQCVRKLWYKCIGIKLGNDCHIDMGVYIMAPNKLQIGANSHINQGCILDSRGDLKIGNNVSISHRVVLMSGSHDINSPKFDYKGLPIVIDDHVFIGVNATILQNVIISEGAVVCAGAVVTKNVPEYAIVAGIPAKIIGYRNKNINYKCCPDTWFL